MTVRHFTSKDAKFYQYSDRQIFVGDVLDSSKASNDVRRAARRKGHDDSNRLGRIGGYRGGCRSGTDVHACCGEREQRLS